MSAPSVPRVELAPGYSVARILNGGWQLSTGHSRSPIDAAAAVDELIRLAEAGFTTIDCADIYTGVEELIGRFLGAYERRREIQIHTKFVPDFDALRRVDKRYVERVIDRSLRRLRVDRLDLVQFHWWNPSIAGYVEAGLWLQELQQAGKIRLLGATNFGVPELRQLLDAGVPIVSHQQQYSLIDRRPEHGLVELCAARGVKLLAYGVLAGGLFSEGYLGAARPADPLPNRSLVKYRLMIDEFGGWKLFQELLAAAHQVAEKHGVSIANVAARWVLDRPQVAGVILGARSSAHAASNLRVFSLALDDEDRRLLDAVVERSSGPSGDVFELERMPRGHHAVIMRTDLNRLEE